MADQDVQVPGDENLRAAQAAAVDQPPQPPRPQNQQEPANNAAGEEVTLEVCSMFLLTLVSHTCSCISYSHCGFSLFSVHVMPRFKTYSFLALRAILS